MIKGGESLVFWYRLDSIEVLPSDISDLVDEDYLCPVMVFSKVLLDEEGWGPTLKDEVYDDVYIRNHDHKSPDSYIERYGNCSFNVIVEEEEFDADVCVRAVKRLNEVLRERDENFRFEYDQNMIKGEDENA